MRARIRHDMPNSSAWYVETKQWWSLNWVRQGEFLGTREYAIKYAKACLNPVVSEVTE